MVRQAHHERNQQVTVRPELVEGLNQIFLNKKATAGYITPTELPRFIHARTRTDLSRRESFLIPDNIHPYQNLFIDDAVLLARVAIYIYYKLHQLLSWQCHQSENP